MFCIYFNHLLIPPFLGCPRGSEGERETKVRRDGKEKRESKGGGSKWEKEKSTVYDGKSREMGKEEPVLFSA